MFYVNKKNNYFDDFDKFFTNAFAANTMKSDLIENENCYELNVDMPGAKKEDISISFNDDVLTVKYEAKNEENESKKKFVFKERNFISQERSFYLENANQEDIKAKYENGVLQIRVGKTLPVETKKLISIE